jgi:acetyltransferase-like isoleucine patch superfamily enzyme
LKILFYNLLIADESLGDGDRVAHEPPQVDDTVPTCPTTRTINGSCHGRHGQTLTNVVFGVNSSISGVKLAGVITNQGLAANLTILPGATFKGGKMSGDITNQGTIKDLTFAGHILKGGELAGMITVDSDIKLGLGTLADVTLLPNTTVKGGRLTGKIKGKPNKRALITEALLENTELSDVFIGKRVRFGKGVKIGRGVRFIDNAGIPEGAHLTAAISKKFAETLPQALDMSTDVVTDAPNLLEQVNDIPYLKDNDWQLTQDPETGVLKLTVGDISYAVIPVRLQQTKKQHAGFTPNLDGSVNFVTAKGRYIQSPPVVQDIPALGEALVELDMDDLVLQKNGVVSAKFQDGKKVAARADIAAYPVGDDEPEGLFPTDSDSVRLVFVDENGQKREQLIHPFCADPEALYDHQANVQEKTDLELAHDGTVSFTIEGKRYHGIFDYVVHPSDEGEKPKKAQLEITPIVEEGKTVGLTITYPTGETQILRFIDDAIP